MRSHCSGLYFPVFYMNLNSLSALTVSVTFLPSSPHSRGGLLSVCSQVHPARCPCPATCRSVTFLPSSPHPRGGLLSVCSQVHPARCPCPAPLQISSPCLESPSPPSVSGWFRLSRLELSVGFSEKPSRPVPAQMTSSLLFCQSFQNHIWSFIFVLVWLDINFPL